MKRIYIAGAYSANNIITVLDNMRRGMRAATEVLLLGYAPFAPWFDYHFSLMLLDNEQLDINDYYEYSVAWLAVCDAVLVLPNSEYSNGTKRELEYAVSRGIPVFHSIDELRQEMVP